MFRGFWKNINNRLEIEDLLRVTLFEMVFMISSGKVIIAHKLKCRHIFAKTYNLIIYLFIKLTVICSVLLYHLHFFQKPFYYLSQQLGFWKVRLQKQRQQISVMPNMSLSHQYIIQCAT